MSISQNYRSGTYEIEEDEVLLSSLEIRSTHVKADIEDPEMSKEFRFIRRGQLAIVYKALNKLYVSNRS